MADRFIEQDGRPVVDLATGSQVLFRLVNAGQLDEQRIWAVRCDALQKLHHPALARLVDFGAAGESQCFEAWGCDGTWRGTVKDAERARADACAVLAAAGLSIGTAASVAAAGAHPVLVPDSETGHACGRAHRDEPYPVASRGISIVARRAVAALAELFDLPDAARPRVASLWGPEGAGSTTAVSELARAARLRGYVPLSARLFAEVARLVQGRSLFLLDVEDSGPGWAVLIQATLQSARPHVLLFVGREERAGAEGIALGALTVEELMGALSPPGDRSTQDEIRRLAERSGGWPGRFAELVWRRRVGAGSPSGLRAAERPAVYGETAAVPSGVDGAWPAAGELAALRGRLESAVRLAEAGRHAQGERALRRTIGRLSRRRDWGSAADGHVALGDMLRRRGRAREAYETLQSAAECGRRAGEPGRLVAAAVHSAAALVDLARLDEAEAVVTAGMAAARSAEDRPHLEMGAAVLARVLFWRARYDEAEAALSLTAGATGPGHLSPELAARIAVGRQALELAISRACGAVERARSSGDPRALADAAYGSAFAHLAVADLASAERDVAVAVGAARLAREPLRAIRSRLLLVEALRRSGRALPAVTLLNRMARKGLHAFPPIVQARCDLLREVMSGSAPVTEIVARHVAATGLNALALFVRPLDAPKRPPAALDPMVDDLVTILELCHNSNDETPVLLEVCRRVRGRVHAVSLSVAVFEGPASRVVVSDGGRPDMGVAERVRELGSTVPPCRQNDRLEAGAPVHYGGAMIGAIVARWTVGTPHDLRGVASLLTAAAAAVAPILAAAVARRRQAEASSPSELRGQSRAMADVRQMVDRAAGAPFAVLLEGESGSGKELVARALHRAGPRRDRQFCTVNCAALPDELVEAELFGHARGAFTGAVSLRPGVFEEAHGGTLLLDEIGELSPRAQAKLLRVLQDGEIRRVGENVARRIDVRVLSATNRDLRAEVVAGRFRRDLLYRLDVIRIAVPPLRERREDIPMLAEHFWRDMAARIGSRATLSTPLLAALARYDWPGNVRELQNVLASLLVRTAKRGVVLPTALGPQFGEPCPQEATRLDVARRTFEERFVRAALARTGGHRGRTAEELGVTRQGLTKLLTRLSITR